MKKLTVETTNQGSYKIYIEENLLNNIATYLKDSFDGKKVFIITDKNVASFYLSNMQKSIENAGFKTSHYIIEPGETSKNIKTYEDISSALLEFSMTRSDLVVALGGGVVGDLAGFVSATYLRGIDFIQIPTSLLAQVDSSVGGKVAIDLNGVKNVLGSFYHPKGVIIDPNTLDTLPKRFYQDGMAEVIKYGVLFNEVFLEKLELMCIGREDIIYNSCAIKADIIRADEFEKDVRMFLNFGHTLGHAIESFYDFKKYTHGEAVSIGMYNITKLAEKKNLTSLGTSQRIKKILIDYELPFEFPDIDKLGIIKNIKNDKKNIDNQLNIVIAKSVGNPDIYKTDISFFEEI